MLNPLGGCDRLGAEGARKALALTGAMRGVAAALEREEDPEALDGGTVAGNGLEAAIRTKSCEKGFLMRSGVG